jgi:hypothetical protein
MALLDLLKPKVRTLEDWSVPVPGAHNALNALAAIAVATHAGLADARPRRDTSIDYQPHQPDYGQSAASFSELSETDKTATARRARGAELGSRLYLSPDMARLIQTRTKLRYGLPCLIAVSSIERTKVQLDDRDSCGSGARHASSSMLPTATSSGQNWSLRRCRGTLFRCTPEPMSDAPLSAFDVADLIDGASGGILRYNALIALQPLYQTDRRSLAEALCFGRSNGERYWRVRLRLCLRGDESGTQVP